MGAYDDILEGTSPPKAKGAYADVLEPEANPNVGLPLAKRQAKVIGGILETVAGGVVDLANSGVSGAYGLGKAALAKAAGLPFGEIFSTEFSKSYNGVANAIPYLPETEQGKAITHAVGTLFNKVIQGVGDELYLAPTRVHTDPFDKNSPMKEPSPALGALGQAVMVGLTLGIGGKSANGKSLKGKSPPPKSPPPALGSIKNLEGAAYEAPNWNDPQYTAKWAQDNYPDTVARLQASSVGKVIRDEYKSVDAFNKLHSVLNNELQLPDGGGLPLTQKFIKYLEKSDPDGTVPTADKLKIVNSTIAQMDDLNRLANINMSPEQMVQARTIRPPQSPANLIKRQFNVQSKKDIELNAAAREADFKAALKDKVGYVIDPVTSIERPLTAGEYLDIQQRPIDRPSVTTGTGIYESDPVTGVVVKELSMDDFKSYQQPKTEILLKDEVPKISRVTGKPAPNGSGESPASAESISRLSSQNAAGIEQYMINPDSGKVTPLRTVDRVDQRAPAGSAKVERSADGKFTVIDNNSGFTNEGLLAKSQKLVIEGKQAEKARVASNREGDVRSPVVPIKGKLGGKQAGILLNDTPEAIANNMKVVQELGDKTKTITPAGILTSQRYQELNKALDDGRDFQRTPQQSLKDGAQTKILDTSGPVKNALERGGDLGIAAKRRFNLVRGAHSRAINVFDDAWKQITQGADSGTLRNAESLVAARTIVAIDLRKGLGKVQHVKGTNAVEMDAFVSNLKSEIGAEQYSAADAVASKVFQQYKQQLADSHDAGILTDSSYIAMHNIEYSPTEYLNMIDPEHTFNFNGQSVTVRDSGIQAIGKGSTETMRVDMKGLLAETVLRTQSRIMKNEASKALFEFASANPDNTFVKAFNPTEWDEFGVAKGVPEAPEGFTRIDSLVDGNQHPMFMRNDFAEQWVRQKTEITADMANQLRFWSGSSIVKTLATSLNPVFPLISFPKDLAHIWAVNEAQYSAQLPMYLAQMGMDLITVLPDALARRGRWNEFAKEGGMQEVMSQQGPSSLAFGSDAVSKMTHTTTRHITEVIGSVGTFFENWTRLALRERVIKNGGDSWEASAQAREYLDFSESGSYTKALDSMSPYLSAGVQGSYTVGKAIARDPKTMGWKAAQFLGVSGGATYALMNSNPEVYNQITDHDKINNFIVAPKNMFMIDPSGTKRNIYFQIPIDQNFVPLHATMIAAMDKSVRGVNPSKELFSEINKGSNPFAGFGVPSYDAIQTYTSNYAFWKDDAIWKGGNVNPQDEVIPGYQSNATPEAMVRLGQLTGLSPERLRAAMSNIAPSNPYTNLMGEGIQQALNGTTDYDKSNATMSMIKKLGLGRFVKVTHPFTQEVVNLERAEQDFNSAKGKQTNAINTMVFRESQGNGIAKDEFKSWVSTQPPEDVEGLTKQFVGRYVVDKVFRQLKTDGTDIPSRTWWQATLQAPPEVRADVFYQEWISRPPEARQKMMRLSGAMSAAGSAYRGEKFDTEFAKQLNMFGSEQR